MSSANWAYGLIVLTLAAAQNTSATELESFSEFAMPVSAAPLAAPVSGRLSIQAQGQNDFDVLVDTYGVADSAELNIRDIPPFSFEFVSVGSDFIPAVRGPAKNGHPYWEWVLEPGEVWLDGAGNTQFTVPFALMERAANCVHYGVIKGSLNAGSAKLQMASETCLYFKFNKWAELDISWAHQSVAEADSLRHAYHHEISRMLPTRPIEALSSIHEGLSISTLAQQQVINPADMTLFGAVVDGKHYVSGCETRFGPFPYCDLLPLPSYSLAKSMVAALALLRLEKIYPGTMQLRVSDYVALCADARWRGVNFEHLLDMASGNYISAVPQEDETHHTLPFFLSDATEEKLAFSCNEFPRQVTPGARWVYRSTDTYILSAAIDAFWRSKHGPGADYYNDLIVPIWRELQLSPVIDKTRRTEGQIQLPYAGYGLIFHRDDIARLAVELSNPSDAFMAHFDEAQFAAALQQNPVDFGLKAGVEEIRYNNGFWAWNMKDTASCRTDSWVPFMSGYGGISVVIMPEGTIYYYFSDSGKFPIAGPIAAFANIEPICKELS